MVAVLLLGVALPLLSVDIRLRGERGRWEAAEGEGVEGDRKPAAAARRLQAGACRRCGERRRGGETHRVWSAPKSWMPER